MIEEVFRIPELIRQKRKEEVLEIIEKNNLSIIDVLSILAGQRTAEITKQLCGYCEHGVKKSREAVFCSIWQERRGKAKTACRYFKRGSVMQQEDANYAQSLLKREKDRATSEVEKTAWITKIVRGGR